MILLMSPSRLLPQRMSPSRLLSKHPSQHITPGVVEKILPDSASLCCECSAGAWSRSSVPQCNLDYCKACSDGAHRFVALTGHSPAPLEEPTVVFSVGPLPTLEEVLPACIHSKYFSVDKLLAFQQGSLHALAMVCPTLTSPRITFCPIRLLLQ